jgi:hypothetical protein
MTTSVPSVPVNPTSPVQRLNVFLDKHVLPYPVKYLTSRITILGTLSLLVPLIILANITVFVLLANSYLNVMSVVVSSTVLLYSTLSEARDRAASERREEIAAAQQKRSEERAIKDDQLIEDIHTHIDQIHADVRQHINTSLDNIQNLLVARLEKMQSEDHAHIAETHEAMMSRVAAHTQDLADMRTLLESLKVSGSDTRSG